jgi:type IV secretion system protein VirB8
VCAVVEWRLCDLEGAVHGDAAAHQHSKQRQRTERARHECPPGEPTMSAASEAVAYYQESTSWDADRVALTASSTRTAWTVAIAAWISTLLSAVALLCLLPLKRVEPYVVRVDNATGIVDVVPVYAAGAGVEQSVTRYFLAHYIAVCERFNFAMAESDYEECGAFHSAQRNQAWSALWAPANPASPLNTHRDGSTIRIQVVAVSFFERARGTNDLAQVRYIKGERPGGGGDERLSHWIATIQYTYTAPTSEPRLRRWNPLGFRVLQLTTEPEAPEQPSVLSAGRSADVASGALGSRRGP